MQWGRGGAREEAEGVHQGEGARTRQGFKRRTHRNRGHMCPCSVNMWKGGDTRTTGGGHTFGRGRGNEGAAIAHPCSHAPFARKGGRRRRVWKRGEETGSVMNL